MRLLFIALVAALASCSNGVRSLERNELMRYASDTPNGLTVATVKDGFQLKMMYKPKDLILDQNLTRPSSQSLDSLRAVLKEYDYFILQLSKDGREIEHYVADNQNALNQYLNSAIGNDLFLVAGNDTTYIDQTVYAPSFGSSTHTSVLIIFKSDLNERDHDFTIVFNDSFFRSGHSSFEFDIDNIKRIPYLKL